jgi:hypothetical protein
MMRAVRKELGVTTEENTIIGDTMETDILGGVQLGYHTVLVLSGGTRQEDLQRYAYRPEVVVDSLAELSELQERTDWMPPWALSAELVLVMMGPRSTRNGGKNPAEPSGTAGPGQRDDY